VGGAGVAAEAVGFACPGAAVFGGAVGVAFEAAGAGAAGEVAEIVTVRPSLLKLAITGMVAFTVTTAVPLLSL